MTFRWSRVRQLAREALAQLDVALDVRRSIDSCTLAENSKSCWPAPCRTIAAFDPR